MNPESIRGNGGSCGLEGQSGLGGLEGSIFVCLKTGGDDLKCGDTSPMLPLKSGDWLCSSIESLK